MNVKTRIRLERLIIRAIVKHALDCDMSVSVFDGEETTVKQSKDYREIIRATMTTDEDALILRGNGQKYIINLVYGNDGFDVIADHTDSDYCVNFLRPIVDYIDKLSNQSRFQ